MQDGVDAASPGNTVRVAPGTYSDREIRSITVEGFTDGIEGVLFLKSGVQVLGSGPGSSVLDAQGVATVVVADRGGPGTLLAGFSVRNGGPGSPAGFNFGDGIFVNEGSPFFADLEVESVEGGFAAVEIFGPSTPTLDQVVIRDNGQISAVGAPVWIYAGGAPTLRACVIRDNHGTAASGILVEDAAITLENSVLAGNVGASGGAIHLIRAGPSLISSATVAANTSGTAGAGIHLESSSPRVTGSLIVSNQSLTGQVGGIFFDGVSQPLLDHNDVYSNLETNYQTRSDPTGTQGNISQDPLFLDFVVLDLRLSEGSPAIDAGTPDAPAFDLTGGRRPLDGNRDGLAFPDQGAFEFDRWDVRGVRLEAVPSRLAWDPIPEASGYRIYMGDASDLRTGDFGSCVTMFGEVIGTQFETPDSPALGTAWFFLVTARVDGEEKTRGFMSSGLERSPPPGTSCP